MASSHLFPVHRLSGALLASRKESTSWTRLAVVVQLPSHGNKCKIQVKPYAIPRIMLILWGNNTYIYKYIYQFSSVAQSCPTLCNPMNRSTPGLPVHHQLPEFTQTHVHRVSDAIWPSHPLLSLFPPAPNPSQHQSFFQWVNSSHEVAKVLELSLASSTKL